MDRRYTREKIYDLLPSIYKIRDNEQTEPDKNSKETGGPLKALLEIIGEQVEFVEDDIQQLYYNWFIETCKEWLVPYIGDLLNTKILNPVTRSTSSHRSWVANTISYRRRKGTIATVEQLSRDVTGWNCRAVEFFQYLITTQNLNHLRIENLATIDLRNRDMLELIGTPFDKSAHSVDVRHVESKRGYYNIPNIGIFLWRLQAFPVVNAPAFSLGQGRFTFSQLGHDLPLYNHPETETSIDHIATEINVPTKIRRTALERAIRSYSSTESSFTYQNSIKIVKSSLENGQVLKSQVLPKDIVVCNLSNWHHNSPPPEEKEVAIDPELGRIIFSEPEKIIDVHVSYFYGFSGDMGGGFYDRKGLEEEAVLLKVEPEDSYHYKITKKNDGTTHSSLAEALEEWESEQSHDPRDVFFEIVDSEIYANESSNDPLFIEIPENITITIQSENKERPVFTLKKPITVKGGKGSRIVFDGILFTLSENNDNNTILKILKGDLSELVINHCTFVPARIEEDNSSRYSLGIFGDNTDSSNQNNHNLKILINRSIMGRVDSWSSAASLKIVDSIIDGKGEIEALRCTNANIEKTTIFGKVSSLILELGNNSIFTDIIDIDRRQQGCLRFCYIATGSKIPRSYRCVFEYSSDNTIGSGINGGRTIPISSLNKSVDFVKSDRSLVPQDMGTMDMDSYIEM